MRGNCSSCGTSVIERECRDLERNRIDSARMMKLIDALLVLKACKSISKHEIKGKRTEN